MRESGAKETAESAVGNQVSFEFNLAYRWHSCIGQQDEEWTEQAYKEMFGCNAEDVSMHDLLMGMKKWQTEMPDDPLQRTFANLKRGEDGRFNDNELMDIMADASEQVAGMSCLTPIMRYPKSWN